MSEQAAGGEGAAQTASPGPMDNLLHARALESLRGEELSIYRQARALLDLGCGPEHLFLAEISLTGRGVLEALLGRSWAIRFHSPREMVRAAEAAVLVAETFDPREHGEREVADLRARAEGELANAYRAADDLFEAELGFGRAYSLFSEGTGDRHLRVRLLELESSLLGTRREYALALERLKTVSSVYQDLGEPHLAGRALITRGLYASYSGNTELAVASTEEGLAQIDSQRDPGLFMNAKHNQLLFLVDDGRAQQAKRVLFESRRNFIYQDHIASLRLRGIEGRIFYELRELVSAEIAFREVISGLAQVGMEFYCAITTLDLSAVLLRQGRVEEAEAEVIAAGLIFQEKRILREYLGSIIHLEDCFRMKSIQPETIESVVSYLREKLRAQEVDASGRRR